MTTTLTRARQAAITSGALLFCASVFAACNGDDNASTLYTHDSGSSDSTVGGEGGGGPDAQPLAICATYGGYAGVQKIANDLVTAVSADCRIGAHFAALDAKGKTHLSECLQQQFGTFFGCPGVTYIKDSAGNTCRPMDDAHSGLKLTSADFDAFMESVVSTLKNDNVSKTDTQALVYSFFNPSKGAIVQNAKSSGNSDCTCPGGMYNGTYCLLGTTDGGLDADSGLDDGGSEAAADTGSVSDAPTDTGGGG